MKLNKSRTKPKCQISSIQRSNEGLNFMPNSLQFKIVTPERVVFEDSVDEVILPTVEGEIAVLPNHIPLVSLLQAGILRIKKEAKKFLSLFPAELLRLTGKALLFWLILRKERTN